MQTAYHIILTHDDDNKLEADEFIGKLVALTEHTTFTAELTQPLINEAIYAAMDRWLADGTKNADRMREYIDELVYEATCNWQEAHVEATSDEEEEIRPGSDVRDRFDYEHGGFSSKEDRDSTLQWLHVRAFDNAKAEDSGDLFRIWVEDDCYFWPENATEDRWMNCL